MPTKHIETWKHWICCRHLSQKSLIRNPCATLHLWKTLFLVEEFYSDQTSFPLPYKPALDISTFSPSLSIPIWGTISIRLWKIKCGITQTFQISWRVSSDALLSAPHLTPWYLHTKLSQRDWSGWCFLSLRKYSVDDFRIASGSYSWGFSVHQLQGENSIN